MERHLTVSGFVVHEGRVALHWHRKLACWLPAGGHIEPNEDQVEAVLREIREEFAIEAEVLPLGPRVSYTGGPKLLEPPYTILECWIAPDHCHIDNVYFCRAVSGYPGTSYDADSPIVWVGADQLAAGSALQDGADVPFPPDVQALGIAAIEAATRLAATT